MSHVGEGLGTWSFWSIAEGMNTGRELSWTGHDNKKLIKENTT